MKKPVAGVYAGLPGKPAVVLVMAVKPDPFQVSIEDLVGSVEFKLKVFVPTSLKLPDTGKMLPTSTSVLAGNALLALLPPEFGTTLPTKVFVKFEPDFTKKPVPTGSDGLPGKPAVVLVMAVKPVPFQTSILDLVGKADSKSLAVLVPLSKGLESKTSVLAGHVAFT